MALKRCREATAAPQRSPAKRTYKRAKTLSDRQRSLESGDCVHSEVCIGQSPRKTTPTVARPLQPVSSKSSSPTTANGDFLATPAALNVTCREFESEKIFSKVRESLVAQAGTALYVSGVPGTGKTHTVRKLVENLDPAELGVRAPNVAYINCMGVQSNLLGAAVLSKLQRAEGALQRSVLGVRGEQQEQKRNSRARIDDKAVALASACKMDNEQAMKELRSFVLAKPQKRSSAAKQLGMNIIVMDELDHACKRAEGLVRDLFALAMTRGSRLVAIGIANKLDLTERLLRDLKSCAVAPSLVPFHSYTAKQILTVLKEKYSTIFEAKALEFAARKVASASGDMRAALSMCEAARCDAIHSTDAAGCAASLVTVSQMAAVLKQAGSCVSSKAQTHVAAIRALPVQQQLLLCTLAMARSAAAPPDLTPAATPPPKMTPRMSALFPACKPLTPARTPTRTPTLTPTRTPTRAPLALFDAFNAPVTPPRTPGKAAAATPQSKIARSSLLSPSPRKPAVGRADLTVDAMYAQYKARSKEAGLATVGYGEVKGLVDMLYQTGLLNMAAGAAGATPGKVGDLKPSSRVLLGVGTDDVKHALADCRILQPLVSQLR